MSSTSGTRGIRNNNPGNIDYNKANDWQGQLGLEQGVTKPRFARFDSPENGIRALAKTLLTYQRKHKLRTVRDIINRWAPSVENNTAAYVRSVEKQICSEPMADVDLSSPVKLTGFVVAIIKHENAGYEYPAAVVLEGVKRALA